MSRCCNFLSLPLSQVASGFLFATLVGLGLIFLVQAENPSRQLVLNYSNFIEDKNGPTSSKQNPIFKNKVQPSVDKFYGNFLSGMEKLRGTRDASSNKIRHGRKLKIESEAVTKQEIFCYNTDDVLLVVGLTCFVNFSFVLFIWGFVRIIKVIFSNKKRRKLEEIELDDSDIDDLYQDEKTFDLVRKSYSVEELSRWEC